ncbi:hypothetical protein, partial [Halorhodospira sp. 9622]|uniref:hypothetical protein n=1 Tax=Halorhodospira sp. 9622 TaxID=2899136 RepID=UPI001EE8777B
HWLDKPHRGLDGGSVSDGDKEGGQADVAGTALVAPLEGVRLPAAVAGGASLVSARMRDPLRSAA